MTCCNCGEQGDCRTFTLRSGSSDLVSYLCPRCCRGFGVSEQGAHGESHTEAGGFASREAALSLFFRPLFSTLVTGSFGGAHRQTCPGCGKGLSAIFTDGLAGCPECYGAFSTVLGPLIGLLHDSRTHRGVFSRQGNRLRNPGEGPVSP